jgi:hypothetical protein
VCAAICNYLWDFSIGGGAGRECLVSLRAELSE